MCTLMCVYMYVLVCVIHECSWLVASFLLYLSKTEPAAAAAAAPNTKARHTISLPV